ncbi:ORF3 [Sandewavirus dungfly]|nr:ORF3 [Sandewavirus dungfly]
MSNLRDQRMRARGIVPLDRNSPSFSQDVKRLARGQTLRRLKVTENLSPSVPAMLEVLNRVNSPKKKESKRLNVNVDEFKKYFDYALSVMTDITFLMFFALSVYLCYDHSNNGKSSLIYKFVVNFVTSFPIFKKSLCKIYSLIVSLVPFIPVVISVPPYKRFTSVLMIFAYYFFLPEKSVFEYLVHSICMLLFVKTKITTFKIFSLVIFVVSYIMQFAIPLETGVQIKCSNNTLV